MGSLSNDVLSVQRTKGSAFAIIIDEVMTQTFGQLGSGSGWTTRGTQRLHASAHIETHWMTCGRKMVRGCCERQPSRVAKEHLLHATCGTPDTFASRRTGAKAQNSCAGQRIDAVTSYNTPLGGHLATA